MIEELVGVTGGLIAGTADGDDVRAFKGIPYAAAPIGDLRWRAPQAVVGWAGVRDAQRFGPACPQPTAPSESLLGLFAFTEPPECGFDEDCLNLNVWTAAGSADERRPVIVWIHGGAHMFGGGSHPVSLGSSLARRGAVVVTFNYRLGALGYLAHPELTREAGTSGNYAVQDVVAALRWVQDNIAQFGGDPDRVTIFGHSAGAQHVAVLMALPQARGLFHAAIGAGGGLFGGGMFATPMRGLADAEAVGAELFDGLGARTLEDMRGRAVAGMSGPFGFWGPIVDGYTLPTTVETVFASGGQAKVPLITGFTTEEASALPLYEPHDLATLRTYARSTFSRRSDTFLALYAAVDDEQARAQGYRLRRDGGMAYQAWKWATLHEATTPSTFLYCFGRPVPLPSAMLFRDPVPPDGYGAWHGSELWYFFDTLHTQPFSWHDADHDLAQVMGNALVRFAELGSPAEDWPRFTSTDTKIVALNEYGAHLAELPNREQLEFFAQIHDDTQGKSSA